VTLNDLQRRNGRCFVLIHGIRRRYLCGIVKLLAIAGADWSLFSYLPVKCRQSQLRVTAWCVDCIIDYNGAKQNANSDVTLTTVRTIANGSKQPAVTRRQVRRITATTQRRHVMLLTVFSRSPNAFNDRLLSCKETELSVLHVCDDAESCLLCGDTGRWVNR